MKKISFLLPFIMLTSCASMHYGNFTNIPENKDIYLAHDAAMQLVRVYPPALNKFYINQKIKDDFGHNLILEMRKKGYGLIERVSRNEANFYYVLDELEGSHLYRVSLFIGAQSLSRVYAQTDEKLVPVSSWTYKE